MNAFKKLVAGTLAALTLGLAVTAGSTPASAGWRHYYGPAVIGGIAFGALAAAAIASNAPYGDCYVTRQPVYDRFGNFMGYRGVRVCN